MQIDQHVVAQGRLYVVANRVADMIGGRVLPCHVASQSSASSQDALTRSYKLAALFGWLMPKAQNPNQVGDTRLICQHHARVDTAGQCKKVCT